jgi:hypothetical protein
MISQARFFADPQRPWEEAAARMVAIALDRARRGELGGYDIIGDVHGQAGKLEALLKKLGYAVVDGAWRHPRRVAIFVGDFIDRGPRQRDVVAIVRAMVEAGSALAVMGNHELNAIAWATPHQGSPGHWLRRRDGEKGERNRHHHQEFLTQVGADSSDHQDMVAWFLTLPLFLDLPGLRVAHACWHSEAIDFLTQRIGPLGVIPPLMVQQALGEPPSGEPRGPSALFDAIELVCKGVEIELPDGASYHDQDGIERSLTRSRWWDADALTFRQSALISERLRDQLPDSPIPAAARLPTLLDKPIFFGHYWMTGLPEPLSSRAACVDYSAAKGGPLVAYRFDGEALLSAENFVSADDLHPGQPETLG